MSYKLKIGNFSEKDQEFVKRIKVVKMVIQRGNTRTQQWNK